MHIKLFSSSLSMWTRGRGRWSKTPPRPSHVGSEGWGCALLKALRLTLGAREGLACHPSHGAREGVMCH
jgi:hypothetical protein